MCVLGHVKLLAQDVQDGPTVNRMDLLFARSSSFSKDSRAKPSALVPKFAFHLGSEGRYLPRF